MKLMIVLLAIAFGVWLWRSRRPPPSQTTPRRRAGTIVALEMTRCDVCGLHLPLTDAQRTRRGTYCSVEHRRQREG
jgi:uncharacterized protein